MDVYNPDGLRNGRYCYPRWNHVFASLDLVELVGPDGLVIAMDKSERFLAYLDATCHERRIYNITTCRADFDDGELPDTIADRAWCRWVLSFVKDPRTVLSHLSRSLLPGGVIVLQEYFDYATWKTVPTCPEVEEFVSAVMASWRENGGEPNVALMVPHWLEELGFELLSVHPILDIVQTQHTSWTWLRTFLEVGRRRLVELEYLTPHRAESIWRVFTDLEVAPGNLDDNARRARGYRQTELIRTTDVPVEDHYSTCLSLAAIRGARSPPPPSLGDPQNDLRAGFN